MEVVGMKPQQPHSAHLVGLPTPGLAGVHGRHGVLVSDIAEPYPMEIKHTRYTPVHIIGHARSGTSLLSRLLREHLEISFGTESQFIIRYFHKLHKYGDLRDLDFG